MDTVDYGGGTINAKINKYVPPERFLFFQIRISNELYEGPKQIINAF